MLTSKTSIISAVLLTAVLLGAGVAIGVQSAFAGDGDGEKKHSKGNCDITTFLAPDGDTVISITAVLMANQEVNQTITTAVNETVTQNVTQEISQNTTVTDEIDNAIGNVEGAAGDNITQQVIEVLVNQTVAINVAQEVAGQAVVDVVQSGQEVTEDSVNASATAILQDNETVAQIANETVTDLNSTDLANQVGNIVLENPSVVEDIVTQVAEEAQATESTGANGNATEQATKVLHMTTTGIPEGTFKLVDPANNNTVVQDFSVNVKGGVPAGKYVVTIEPANEQTAQAVIEATPDTGNNSTGTLQAENNTNAELPPQFANESEDQTESPEEYQPDGNMTG